MKIRAISPNVVNYTRKSPRLNFRWVTDLKSWLINIFKRKHYLIKCDNLKRGQWYDCDTRLFEINFQILVNYVEDELAWMQLIAENRTRWYQRWIRIKDGRELGLRELNWEIEQGEDSPEQSESAKKIRDLYLWYKDVRPNRIDPFENVPESDFKLEEVSGGGRRLVSNDSDEYHKALNKAFEMEQEQYVEDTQRIQEIIQIRQMMWT